MYNISTISKLLIGFLPHMILVASQLSCIRQEKTLFRDLSFQIHPGEVLLIEGPNGSGKTSLLRLLSGLATPASGTILWGDKNIHAQRHDYWQNLHYVSHQQGIKLGLTVEENIRLALAMSCQHVHPEKYLTLLQLDQHKKTLASALSAGQKRRLALLRLFTIPKKIWLLDEPTTSLDKNTQKIVQKKLMEHLNSGGMCVLSSHQAIDLDPSCTMHTLDMSLC